MPWLMFTLLFFLEGGTESLVRCGDAAYRRCENDSARTYYEQAYRSSPRDITVLLRLVRISNDDGRLMLRTDKGRSEQCYRSAVAWADTLDKYAPRRVETKFWKALTKGSLIPFVSVSEKISIGKEVRTELAEILLMDSSYAMAYVILGIFEREGSQLTWLERTIVKVVFGEDLRGSLDVSERYFKKAIQLDPANSYAWFEYSQTYRLMGNVEAALRALDRVISLRPGNARERQQRDEALKWHESIENHRSASR